MNGRFKTPDGRSLAYRDEGRGSAVLCLAGLTRDGRDFAMLARHLTPRYRVIRLDARGRGQSTWADQPLAEYQVPVEAGDALALLDHLGVDRVTVIGTSRGGMQGMVLGATQRDRLNGLVLNDVGPVIEPDGLTKIMGYVGIDPGWPSFSDAATALAQSMGAAFPDLTGEQWMTLARSIYADDDGRPRLSYDPKLRDAVEASMKEAPPDLWALFDALGDLPILAIRGENSDVLSAGTLALMQARRADLKAVTIPGRGHVPFLDEPPALDAIDAFLAAHG